MTENTYAITEPRYARADRSMIDVVWDHPLHGSIPYTATADSGTTHGQHIWNGLQAGIYGPIAPFEPIDLRG